MKSVAVAIAGAKLRGLEPGWKDWIILFWIFNHISLTFYHFVSKSWPWSVIDMLKFVDDYFALSIKGLFF